MDRSLFPQPYDEEPTWMRTDQQSMMMIEFLRECEEIYSNKNPGYNPEGIAYGDLIAAQKETDTPVEVQLYILMRKHWAALTSYIKSGVETEAIRGRLKDLAVYSGLIAVWLDSRGHTKCDEAAADTMAAISQAREDSIFTRSAGTEPSKPQNFILPMIVEPGTHTLTLQIIAKEKPEQ